MAAESCHKINAKGIGQDLGNVRTTADINGGGLLNGTTAGAFGISPTADPNVLDLVGTVVFTNKATLTVAVSGTFDTGTGEFAASGPATAATGKLAGATGNLRLAGVEDLSTGEVHGERRLDSLSRSGVGPRRVVRHERVRTITAGRRSCPTGPSC